MLCIEEARAKPKQYCASIPDAPTPPVVPPMVGSCPNTYLAASTFAGQATVSGAAIGTPDPGRIVVVTIVGYRSPTTQPLLNVTFNGVSVRFIDNSGNNLNYCCVAWGRVPLGTTMDIVANFTSSIGYMQMSVCNAIGGLANPFVRSAGVAIATTPAAGCSVSVTLPVQGVVYGAFAGSPPFSGSPAGGPGPTTWVGANTVYDVGNAGHQLSTAEEIYTASQLLTVSANNTNDNKSLSVVTVGSATTVTTPSIVQSAAATQASGRPSVNLPANPTPGNVLIAMTNTYTNGGAMAGWQALNVSTTDINDLAVIYYRVVQAGDGKTVEPAVGYGSFPSNIAVWEIANYDDGWQVTAFPTIGSSFSGIASYDWLNQKTSNVTSYSDTVSSTFDQTLVLGAVEAHTSGVAPTMTGATADHSVPGSGGARAITSFHLAGLGVGSATITANFSPADEFTWNCCVIAPRYR